MSINLNWNWFNFFNFFNASLTEDKQDVQLMTWYIYNTMIKVNKMIFCTFIKKECLFWYKTFYVFFFYFKGYFSVVAYVYMIVTK